MLMKKQRIVTRILATAFVGLLMILGMTGVSSVIAADEATAADIQLISETAVAPDVDLPSNDELFTGYLEQMFYGNNGVSTFAVGNNMAGARLEGDEKLAYDALVHFISDTANGKETYTEVTLGVSGTTGAYKIVDFTGLADAFDLSALINALLSDYPYEMYWYDKTAGCKLSGSVDGNGYIKALTFSFYVADNYQYEATEFMVNTTNTYEASSAVEYATSIVNENADKSDYEKLVAYRDAIMDLVEYNDAAAKSGTFSIDNDPWQLVYVFDQNAETNVVCEGYSKAFQYLCDLTTFSGDVSCYSVSGTMDDGAHMWNIVTIDGANYLVDVTNSDGSSVGSDGTLFLAGINGSIADGYIFTNTHSQAISFVYDEDTINFWGSSSDSILGLASSNYSEPSLQNTIYVASTGDDSNAGTSNAPVKTIEQALELVGEGGTIQIVNYASSERLDTDEPLRITKNITITGGELTLERAGIVLGADVTFDNISIYFANAVRNAIIANGYTLNLNNVNGNGTYPIHLFCGGVTGYTGGGTIPASGTEGRIIISGSNNNLADIFAGSLSEYGDSNEWNGSSEITISSGAGGTIGYAYAHGATEPRGQGDTGMTPDSTNYTVTGAVTINLSGSKPAKVYGTTGGSSNADVVVTGGGNLISGLTLNNLASLKVASGTFQPEALNENVDVTISQGAELDLSTVIEDGSYFRVEDFVGGGTLALGREDQLCIMGTVSGTTEFQVTDGRPNDKRTSGTVRYSFEYIDMSWADGDCEFTFVPHELQVGTTLEHSYDESGNVWITSAAPVIKPDSFDVLTDTYTMTVEDAINVGVKVPISCGLKEYESFKDISLSITISKDGAEAVVADKNEDYGVYYSVDSLGFEEIFAAYDENGADVICIYCDDAGLEAGVYTINISVVLADNSTATETITLYVRGEGEHVHSWSYSASGATITATCIGMIGDCDAVNKSITIEAPAVDTLTYNGTAKEATVSGSIDGVTTPTIAYTAKDGSSLTDGKPVNAGAYTASITLGGAVAEVDFDISPMDIKSDVEVNIYYGNLPYATIKYTGESMIPTSVGVFKSRLGIELTNGTDYEVTYPEDMTNVGVKVITITGKGNYTGTIDATLEITKLEFRLNKLYTTDGTAIMISYNLSKIYDGSVYYDMSDIVKADFSATPTIGDSITKTLTIGTDCNISITFDSANVGINNYNVSVEALDGFDTDNMGLKEFSLQGKIKERDITITIGNKTISTNDAIPEVSEIGWEITEGTLVDGHKINMELDYAGEDSVSVQPVAGTEGEYKVLNNGLNVLDSEDAAVTTNYNFNIVDGKLTIVKHEHDWKYTVEGATIKATCEGIGTCDVANKSVTLSAPGSNALTYNGSQIEALLSSTNVDDEDIPVISYEALSGGSLTDGKPVNAGTYTASITFGEETVSITYEIKKAELTVVGATATSRYYNVTSAVEITDIALSGILSSDEVKVDLTGVMGTLSSANAGSYTSVTLPVLTLTGTDAGNYTLIQPTMAITTSVTISPLDTIITLGADKYDKTFGDAAFSLDVNVTNSESDVQYSVTAGADVVSVSAGTVTILKAGTATITVSLPASTNYNAAESKTVTINVAKKTGYTVDTINKSYLYSRENSDSISLAELLPTDCGEVSYGSPVVRESAVFSVAPAISNGVLSYTVGAGAVSDAAQVTVVVASDNYEDFIIQLVVVLTDKLPVSLKEGTKVTLKNNTLTYGETLSKLEFDSVVFVDEEGNEVKGTLAWKAPSTVPNAGTTSASWVFTPNSEEYLSLEGMVSVTVNKATPVIETTPVATAITYGDMLKDSVLTGGITKYSASNNTIVAGSFAWKNGTVKPVVADSGKTAYTVVFTPADTVNYNSVEADIILTINKADNAPNMPESTKNVSNGTKNVGEVDLPEGWTWAEADKDKALEIGAVVNATAVYSGEDKGNYENESVVIAITRSACEHEGGTATCKDKAVCTLCGEAYGELSTVHSYTGVITKEPTTEAEGVKTYTCSVCGDSYTEPIPKLDQPGGGSEGGATPEPDDKPEDNPSDVPSTEPEYEEEYVYDPKDSVEQHWSGNTGWQKISGEWYYFNDSGKLDTGWVQDTDDSWYYMDENTGKMATGWLQSEESGLWYYMDNTRGNMLSNGWLCDDASGRWYYLNENGAMCTGWIFVDDTWYLLDKNGAMCTGWNLVDGKWYYLDMSGKCLLNTTTPDGYKVDENGVWVTE